MSRPISTDAQPGDDGWDYELFRTNLESGAFDSDLLIERREMARVARHLIAEMDSLGSAIVRRGVKP